MVFFFLSLPVPFPLFLVGVYTGVCVRECVFVVDVCYCKAGFVKAVDGIRWMDRTLLVEALRFERNQETLFLNELESMSQCCLVCVCVCVPLYGECESERG